MIPAIVEALRRNDKLQHAVLLGITAAALFGSMTWIVLSLGIDALAYIDEHGREKTRERVDSFTTRAWNGTE